MSPFVVRPWYEWVGWFIWLLFIIVFAQGALASRVELESRAAAIGWTVVGLLILLAVAIWVPRFLR